MKGAGFVANAAPSWSLSVVGYGDAVQVTTVSIIIAEIVIEGSFFGKYVELVE